MSDTFDGLSKFFSQSYIASNCNTEANKFNLVDLYWTHFGHLWPGGLIIIIPCRQCYQHKHVYRKFKSFASSVARAFQCFRIESTCPKVHNNEVSTFFVGTMCKSCLDHVVALFFVCTQLLAPPSCISLT